MNQLFSIISLLYVFIGIRTIWTAAKNRRALTDNELTPWDRQQLNSLAFFALVPIGVLFHELGHAAATYQMGGYIDWLNGGFNYGFFYGSVLPIGRFTPLQDWWISVAGNLVSVIFGFLGLGGIFLAKKSWLKFWMVSFARTQFTLTLIGYPLMSLIGFFGDWVWIYGTSWFLTIPTAIVHTSLVVGLFLLDRSPFVKRWEIGLYAGANDQLTPLDSAIAMRPQSVDALIARANYFASQNQIDLAIADYRAALKIDSQNPRALYNIGQIRMMQKRYSDAEKNFRAALTRAESDRSLAGRVHWGLGMCLYHRSGARPALAEFDAAIARVSDAPEFYFWRGTARRALGDEANAQNDLARADQLTRAQASQQQESG